MNACLVQEVVRATSGSLVQLVNEVFLFAGQPFLDLQFPQAELVDFLIGHVRFPVVPPESLGGDLYLESSTDVDAPFLQRQTYLFL